MKKTVFGIISSLVAAALVAQGVLAWLFNLAFGILTEALEMNLSVEETYVLYSSSGAELQFITGPILIALAVLCIIGSFAGKKFGVVNLCLFITLCVKFCIDLVFRSMGFFVNLLSEISWAISFPEYFDVSLTDTIFGVIDYTLDALRICGLLLIAVVNIVLFAAIMSKKKKFISVMRYISLINLLLAVVSVGSQLIAALSTTVFYLMFTPYAVYALAGVPLLVDTVSVAVIGIGLCAPMLLAWGGNKGAKNKPTFEKTPDIPNLGEEQGQDQAEPNEEEENPAYSTVDI